ncbi:MAG: dTDP-4-dehydrorhamnose 3,5-epimerase family protein [Porphyromonas sp.]|nr:dTDP-4-dehydrorhamnose 3,5-epimerase family protein [Porphyromonas sp.]
MKITELSLPGVWLIESKIYSDSRGTFMEAYNERELVGTPLEGVRFVQDNLSCSRRGTLRGMHTQRAPYGQSKLVRCLSGRLIDFVLDIIPESPTYGQAISVELTPTNGRALFIPSHYAHGFLSLEEETRLYYKVDRFYHPESEVGYSYRHPAILRIVEEHISPDELILSDKDAQSPLLPTI